MRKIRPIRLACIGKSQGIRIPNEVFRYLGPDRPGLTAEVRPDGLLLKAPGNGQKLSWAATAKTMAAESAKNEKRQKGALKAVKTRLKV